MDVRKIACALMLLAAPSLVSAEEAKGGKAKKGADPEAMMKAMMAAWEKAGTPGDNHKMLQKMVGSWTTSNKAWMGPGEPEVSPGTCEVKSIMDGRYLVEEFTGSMMGKPFVGHSMSGYDNLKKKFVSTWIDNMSTGIMYGEGAVNTDGKMTMSMSYVDAMTSKPMTMRMVSRWEGDNKRVAEFFEKRGGKEMKSMEITYTRKTSAAK